jgi:hypothetical protein
MVCIFMTGAKIGDYWDEEHVELMYAAAEIRAPTWCLDVFVSYHFQDVLNQTVSPHVLGLVYGYPIASTIKYLFAVRMMVQQQGIL